jgi:hypothetical protein
MAINVNTVYTTVLSVLNKEQRGYITPDEFNKLATQVQLEIFEKYFEDLNQQLRVPQTDSEYANRQKNIDSCISIFKTIANPTSVGIGNVLTASVAAGGTGYASSTNVAANVAPGVGLTVNTSVATPSFTITVPGTAYNIGTNIATTGAGAGLTVNITSIGASGSITGISINNPGLGYAAGNIITITGGNANAKLTLTTLSNGVVQSVSIANGGSGYSASQVATITGGGTNATININSVNNVSYFLPPDNLHRIGTVIYKDEKELQRVERNELLNINLSPLTKPTTDFPVYLYEQANEGQSHIYVYPTSITSSSDISISYIKKPKDVVWGFTFGTLGQYIYSASASTQFELLGTEQTEVILKILAYAGVVLNELQLTQQVGSAIQAENINSKN